MSLLAPNRKPTQNNAARCRGAAACDKCSPFIAIGYDHTLCSLAGRPHTPQQRDTGRHPIIREEDLIKKRDLLDPLDDDDDDIEWRHNPFDVDHVSESGETPEELLAKITFEGSELQTKLKALVLEFIDIFGTKVRRTPADQEKQKEIRKQVDALLKLGVIKESQVSEWSQIHLVPKPTPEGTPQKWRFTLDYVRLNSTTGALEGWPIPNIQQIINRVGTLKPKVFGIIDFTAGYHQTKLHPDSQ